MKFSIKTKYGLSTMILLAENYESGQLKSLVCLSQELHISKIYLEQVFAQLKRNDLVISIKGAKGGYRLAKSAKDISVLDILQATEPSLFECEDCASASSNIETITSAYIFEPFQNTITHFFANITLHELKEKLDKINYSNNYMYYL